jgi:hypothetical protein
MNVPGLFASFNRGIIPPSVEKDNPSSVKKKKDSLCTETRESRKKGKRKRGIGSVDGPLSYGSYKKHKSLLRHPHPDDLPGLLEWQSSEEIDPVYFDLLHVDCLSALDDDEKQFLNDETSMHHPSLGDRLLWEIDSERNRFPLDINFEFLCNIVSLIETFVVSRSR